MDAVPSPNLSVPNAAVRPGNGARALVVGEILWDVFSDTTRLGGAALNFAVHLMRLGHDPRIVSAIGTDALGRTARDAIAALGLDATFLQTTARFRTGTASVRLGPGDQPSFVIERPAAYDAVEITDAMLRQVAQWTPAWCYYGTLFPSSAPTRRLLQQLLDALPHARRFYDVNLRPGFDDPALVADLLHAAQVVKLNEDEMLAVHRQAGLPADREGFCREGRRRFGWHAAAVTLGARGCALLAGDDFVESPGVPVAVVDTVGAGDAFAAAFVHGLGSGWPAAAIADFANRAGAAVAAVPGAIPAR
jgi:fructokinase